MYKAVFKGGSPPPQMLTFFSVSVLERLLTNYFFFLLHAHWYRPYCWSEIITVLIKRTTISDILFQQLTHLEGPPGRGEKAREKEGREGKGKGYPTIATNENPGNGFDYVGLFALPHGNAIPFTFIRVKTVVKTQRHIG